MPKAYNIVLRGSRSRDVTTVNEGEKKKGDEKILGISTILLRRIFLSLFETPATGHGCGSDRCQKDQLGLGVTTRPFPDIGRRKKMTFGRFSFELRWLRSPSSGRHCWRSRYGFSPTFHALAACWIGFDQFLA
ncbi:hypothetical protein L3X38_022337 [Prunus dulcis]|uniref:Uncharacterized protein n=1 Tax=Prunus dulcis TaxID=3755 RepID=A0AAD4VVX4_PRUDU|nr:hypothetical protein L3X38_022337 [Prunus dulcis]